MTSHTEPSCYWPQAFISEPSYYWPHALLTSPVITGLVLNYWAQFLLASGLFVAWPTSCCSFITEPSYYWPQAYLWLGPHHVIMLRIYDWAQLLLASGLFVAWPTSCYYVAPTYIMSTFIWVVNLISRGVTTVSPNMAAYICWNVHIKHSVHSHSH